MSIADAQVGAPGGIRHAADADGVAGVAAARALLPRVQAGEDVGEEARALAEAARDAGDGPGECAALYSQMASAAVGADVEGSRWAAIRLVERGSELGLPAWEATGRQYVGRLQLASGHEDVALNEIVTAELLLDDVEADHGLVVALNGLAVAYSRLGLHEDSERTYTRLAEVVYEAGDTWAVHVFIHNRLLNQSAWGVALAQAGLADEAQDRLAIASAQARDAIDMTGSAAYNDFTAMCRFADLMAGELDVEQAREGLEPILANAHGEPESYVRFACAHQLANRGRWDEAREHLDAGLVSADPNETETIRSALVWERARIAVMEHPDHRGISDVWAFAQLAGQKLWRLRRRRVEAVHGKLRVSRLTSEHERAERASLEDPLTGTANRRRIDRERASLLTATSVGWATVIYLDVDRFKAVNDAHGHELGDAVLRELATLLTENVRDGDLVGRYGGDEFVILAAHCPPADAEQLSDRILEAIRGHRWDRLHTGMRIRASLGVAITRSSLSQLFPAADEALYRAKRSGRDRVELTVIGHDDHVDATPA